MYYLLYLNFFFIILIIFLYNIIYYYYYYYYYCYYLITINGICYLYQSFDNIVTGTVESQYREGGVRRLFPWCFARRCHGGSLGSITVDVYYC